jgi:hypothetical protein
MIETWHVAFTASVPPQVFVCEKSPLAAIPERLKIAVPVFGQSDRLSRTRRSLSDVAKTHRRS